MSGNNKVELFATARAQALQATPARQRLSMLFDKDTFVEVDAFAKVGDQGTGVVTGYGLIEGSPVYAFAQDSKEASGAVGKIHAAKIKKLYDLALKTGAPIVGIYDSKGARIDEGADTLAAYGEMLLWANNLSGVVPQVSVVLGVCAGSAAMIAASADFVVMSKRSEFFMTPPIITKSKGQKVEGAGSAVNAGKSGVAHIVADSDEIALAETRKLISLLPLNNLSAAPVCDFAETPDAADALNAACENIDAADAVDLVAKIVDAGSALELQKEFGKNAYTALTTIGGQTVGIVATKGAIDADASAKMARFVSICDAYQLPVVTLVNTEGFVQSADGELRGSIREMARLAHIYAEATTPKIAVITGKAFGPAYITLAGRAANADYTIAWPSAAISALEPRTAVALTMGSKITPQNPREKVEAEYMASECGPMNLAAQGHLDDVIVPADTRAVLLSTLDMLAGKRVSKLPKKHANIPM